MTHSIEIEQHLGCVAKVVSHYWYKLPHHVKVWYDIDDMIGECVVQIIRARERYSKARGGTTTFIYAVSRNYCRQVIESHSQKKRTAIITTFDDVQERVHASHFHSSTEPQMWRRESTEVVLQQASDSLRRVLSAVVTGEPVTAVQVAEVASEAQMLVRRNRLSSHDLIMCLSRGV